MLQHFRLDRLRAVPYLCLVAGCSGSRQPPPAAPLPAISLAEARNWTAATEPSGHRVIRFRWLFNDGQASIGGQGSAHVAGPDSMRFDIAGPWGIGGAAAMVVGDRPHWVQPPEIIARLIPSYPLMWAMFGVMRPPPAGARTRGERQPGVTELEWSQGSDTLRYRLRQDDAAGLRAQWQRAGVTMGVVETRLDARGAPVSARLTVPSVPARLDITIAVDSTAGPFPASVWIPPAP